MEKKKEHVKDRRKCAFLKSEKINRLKEKAESRVKWIRSTNQGISVKSASRKLDFPMASQ